MFKLCIKSLLKIRQYTVILFPDLMILLGGNRAARKERYQRALVMPVLTDSTNIKKQLGMGVKNKSYIN